MAPRAEGCQSRGHGNGDTAPREHLCRGTGTLLRTDPLRAAARCRGDKAWVTLCCKRNNECK